MLANVTDALAFVRFWRIERTDFGGDFAHDHFVRPFNRELGVFLDGDLDLVGNVVIDRMRIAERKVDDLAIDGGLETNALDFQLLHKTCLLYTSPSPRDR